MKKRISLILAAMMAVMAFMAGCSGGNTSGGTDTKTPTTEAPKPVDKQELTFNLGAEPPNLDSTKTTDQVSFEVLANVMEGLVRTGEGFKLNPGMAEKWEPSADNTVYTFHLRKDAKWSDGKPVTAKDFKYAWTRVLDPRTAAEYAYQLYYIKGGEELNSIPADDKDFAAKFDAAVKNLGIETPDDYTLKVTLKQATPYWLGLTAFPTYYPVRQDIVEKFGEKYAADADKMAFNGPFVLESWVHDDSLVMKKNASYWDAKVVKLETINFKMIKDANTAIQMYEAGELDVVGLPGEFIPKYQSDKGFSTMADATTWYITLNHKNPTFANAKIRKAMSLALDRKGFADNVLKNGSVPAQGLVPDSIAGDGGKTFRQISGNHIPVNANAAEAKKLWEEGLKELGVSKLNVSLMSGDTSAAKRYAQGVQEMLQNALPGLTIELEPLAFAVRLDRTKKGEFQMVYAGWGADYNDPMTFMDMWITGSSFNDAKWSNAKYDELVKKAQTTTNNAERMKAMAEAEKILADELPILPLYHPAGNRVERPWVKGILRFPLGADIDFKGAYVEGKAK